MLLEFTQMDVKQAEKGSSGSRVLRTMLLLCATLVIAACNITSTSKSSKTSPEQPNQIAATYNAQLAMGYLKENQVERAKRKLLLALKQGPKYAPAYSAMAYFLEKTGQPGRAGAYYQQALVLSHNAGDALNNYGAYLCRQKHYQAAVQHFIRAAREPNYLTPADAYENAGLCSLANGQPLQAQGFFKKAVVEDPARIASYLELAKLAYDNQQYTEADGYLRQYHGLSSVDEPRSLWLKIQLERHFGKTNLADTDEMLLKSTFPNSKEAAMLKSTGISS